MDESSVAAKHVCPADIIHPVGVSPIIEPIPLLDSIVPVKQPPALSDFFPTQIKWVKSGGGNVNREAGNDVVGHTG